MALTTPPRGVGPGDYLLVVHDFDARGADELTLRRGDKIELVELDDGFGDGWYLGKDVKTETTGLFPGVYTTATPKIPVRKTTDVPFESGDSLSHSNDESDHESATAEARPPITSPKSGETTPQASRHVSASDINVPEMESNPAFPSPKRSSSSPLPATTLDIQHSLRQSIDSHLNGQDSPVMNETLSVIDEHITDLSTPRHSVAPQESKAGNDSASEYSTHLGHRMSYINGHETDEEEENQPTEEEVRKWNHTETAKHCRELAIESKHCDIFEEQEITGDVLLDMDQDFLFMKEFDFGVMGRRLKTWHKIKAFQEEIKGLKDSPRGSTGLSGPEERSFSRAGQNSAFLPRILGFSDKSASFHQARSSGPVQHPRLVSSNMQSTTSSPIGSHNSYAMGTARRPSAASIRDINHSRRHSSMDGTNRLSGVSDSSYPYHQRKPSFDRGWTMASSTQPSRPGISLGTPTETLLPQHVFRGADGSDSAISVTDRYDDLDRGYFSGPEGDTRKNRRVLQKRSSDMGSLTHSQKSSYTDEHFSLGLSKRHSRIASIDSIRDAADRASHGSKAFAPPPPTKGRLRSLSTRITDRSAQRSQSSTPSGSKSTPTSGFFSSFTPFGKSEKADKGEPESPGRSTPMPQQAKNAKTKFRRGVGLRAMSDVIGKGVDTSVPPVSPIKETDPSSARTGSTTPSATSKSSERHSTDGSAKAAEGGISFPRPRASVKAGVVKSKKDTSAYTQGLEKKSPQEQIDGCDFSGWMKKRSSNLMTTWKPRLFVLRGRRLSYYYSETDTEERGLIDITAHRVLRADNDPIVTLHATITGATASPTSPANPQQPEPSSAKNSSESVRAPKKEAEGPFFFKLVPPKTTRTVQFTKPAIHYFQVDNVKQGRLWMAALMKATIDRDMDVPVETSNKQKTISLKQARLMNQRPPALMTTPTTQEDQEEEAAAEEEDKRASAASATDEAQDGLMIKGVGLDGETAAGDGVSEEMPSNPLGGLDTGPSSLLPEALAESK
ncbi:hypothetical protein ASPWEDRAFT_109617 [Aspergillus wentii DTO 134E9]|uniref:SH3 domain-containing protein n=1 Tax=Aspergillus wentii DTO 134E9 TaxID=1073089 RepID=A0A1L9RKP4_ASPWE|nr:uncharacterized protein ASPWEDRAFT_109617 [Aspergillus wentii DTO 134E9]OJJ35474.1 hypothetical protein ASPWEDRAFT_109617 [Aspergillus wentii DTO 134E9]